MVNLKPSRADGATGSKPVVRLLKFWERDVIWRRDRDSNPGNPFEFTRFPSVRLQPLGHLSAMLGRLAAASRYL